MNLYRIYYFDLDGDFVEVIVRAESEEKAIECITDLNEIKIIHNIKNQHGVLITKYLP